MNEHNRKRLRDTHLVDIRNHHFDKLRSLFSGNAPESAMVLWGLLGEAEADPYETPIEWLDQCLDNLAARTETGLDPDVFRPLIIEYGIYGVRFVDKLFDTNVYVANGNWWGDGVSNSVGELTYPDIEACKAWHDARRVAEAFVERELTVPLFGLPTIASPLNVAVNLYGEEFLIALLTAPAAARHDLEVITDLLCDLHSWYRGVLPEEQLQPVIAFQRTQPPGFGQICGCTTHLVAADTYAEHVADLDARLLGGYREGGMIHLCGAHAQHCPVWARADAVRSVQLNDRAAEDLPIYFRELRDDQVIYLNTTETMTADRALEITAGRRLVIVQDRPNTVRLTEKHHV